MFGLDSIYIKIIGGLAAALILLGLVADRGRWMHRAHGDEDQLSTICAAARAAADNPKLDCKLVPQQIAALGSSLKTTTDALNSQNAKVAAMGAETASQQKLAAEASQQAAGRAKRAVASSQGLTASARASERLTKPCEPSKALEGAWK